MSNSAIPSTIPSTPTSLKINDTKAGMTGLDKDKINKIIADASKGSRFYQHAQEKEKQLKFRIDKMLEDRNKLTKEDIKRGESDVDLTIAQLEHSRITSQHIVHVDMDAFYAAVEMRDNPELRDVPLGVGGMSMLSTSNYIARKFGVRAAMPGFIAKKLCPELVIVPGNHAKYKVVSDQVVQVIKNYTNSFSMASLDEGYCDFTDYVTDHTVPREECSLHNNKENKDKSDERSGGVEECRCDPVTVVQSAVQNMRNDIFLATGLTASAGISCNTFLAKVCSDINKPNGQYYLPPDRDFIVDFISEFEAKKVPGIGRVQAATLSALGVVKISDIVPNRGVLACLFSPGTVEFYISVALGLGATRIGERDQRKSLSTETTFSSKCLNIKERLHPDIIELVQELSGELADSLAKEELLGETVSIKVKLDTFVVLQRSKTLDHGVCLKDDIYLYSKSLLEHLISQNNNKTLSIRLLGVRISNFINEKHKQSTILSFINKVQKEVTEWQCPICLKFFPKKLNSFNKHVDKCTRENPALQSEENPVLQLENISTKSQNEATNTKPIESETCKIPQNDKPILITVSDSSTTWQCPICFKEKTADLKTFNKHVDECTPLIIPTDQCASTSKEERWTCPICSNLLAPQLLSFNKHVDKCLGIAPEPQINVRKQTVGGKYNHKKRKHKEDENKNSLKKFFKTV